MRRKLWLAAVGIALTAAAMPAAHAGMFVCTGDQEDAAFENLMVPPNALCHLHDVEVRGNIIVQPGGTIHAHSGVTIGGNVTIVNGSIGSQIYRTTVGGSVTHNGSGYTDVSLSSIGGSIHIKGATDGIFVCGNEIGGDVVTERIAWWPDFPVPVSIGHPENTLFDFPCPGNTIGGSIRASQNDAMVIIRDNVVGVDAVARQNTEALDVRRNHIARSLVCEKNLGPVTGADNTAESKHGQCASL